MPRDANRAVVALAGREQFGHLNSIPVGLVPLRRDSTHPTNPI
jgi:hypothetical protein